MTNQLKVSGFQLEVSGFVRDIGTDFSSEIVPYFALPRSSTCQELSNYARLIEFGLLVLKIHFRLHMYHFMLFLIFSSFLHNSRYFVQAGMRPLLVNSAQFSHSNDG